MKYLLMFSFFLLCSFFANSQIKLTDTKWEGEANVPKPMLIRFEFRRDTLEMIYNGRIVERMNYTLKADTMTLVKLSGSSPCKEEIGQYKVTIKGETLYIALISDDCMGRAKSFMEKGYIKK